ncbi:hypothetical protein [Kingella negevensis]|uniref:hypothetical protein n=1 Tax=Kingella negevensis TaxID=1522312 RepID=UPI0012FE4AF7|nr:hypothetical protein [Kingella negevensis]
MQLIELNRYPVKSLGRNCLNIASRNQVHSYHQVIQLFPHRSSYPANLPHLQGLIPHPTAPQNHSGPHIPFHQKTALAYKTHYQESTSKKKTLHTKQKNHTQKRYGLS